MHCNDKETLHSLHTVLDRHICHFYTVNLFWACFANDQCQFTQFFNSRTLFQQAKLSLIYNYSINDNNDQLFFFFLKTKPPTKIRPAFIFFFFYCVA